MSFRASPIRAFLRSARNLVAEPHPHGRYPVNRAQMHAINYGFYANKFWRTASWYVPVGTALLGWPFMAIRGNISAAWEVEDWQDDVAREEAMRKASDDAREVVELMGRIEAWA
ncbi:hypothetical protein BFW01_g3614 [Lasiodiplodia theobromae]|uniref:Uncharacterized protein n=2 Tax=Lasiodiplodia TaxID=66739 RepID=A0A5N5D8B9_9PEZI|nr:uncharacterized protein LTHEOB_8682 [Lasiodiplodia theobromae]KAB2573887.1 hypothetical protein DBV05_g7433 [Lasiodiplodia theobromae]KAF4541286.1 hypothetical protein LTHEOB_8682 [Lasiodiplodia theobromae]KAF9632751.1 hypothetical protein BFW01_g3614 [Lasiodiplodia theobromae]KAK0661423.1 hypothetical protein DIS24_g2480 [Lasiodiplodia hormozganensis]